jgi:hypothetical protein
MLGFRFLIAIITFIIFFINKRCHSGLLLLIKDVIGDLVGTLSIVFFFRQFC